MGALKQRWTDFRSSLWFVPMLIVVGAIGLAAGMIELDLRLQPSPQERWPRVFNIEAEGARSILSAIASSMITVAGVVFSITIVALTLASSQYTPRVLRNFMRDRANQVVLGVFVGIFTYCLVVLHAISSGADGSGVPALAVLVGMLLVVIGNGFLIFFIHHVAASIQASEITDDIAQETLAAIEHLFPEELGEDDEDQEDDSAPRDHTWFEIPALKTGYIQRVEAEPLLKFAGKHNTVVQMRHGIGQFVIKEMPLASLALKEPPDSAMIRELNRVYAVGNYRTADQDATYGIRQLVDIALKALSPGINDTTTAVNCLDQLSTILAHIGPRHIASRHRYQGGDLRVIAVSPTFEVLIRLAFEQILENGEGNLAIMLGVLSAIERVAVRISSRRRRAILVRQVDRIEDVAMSSLKGDYPRQEVEAHLTRVRALLDTPVDERAIAPAPALVDAG